MERLNITLCSVYVFDLRSIQILAIRFQDSEEVDVALQDELGADTL